MPYTKHGHWYGDGVPTEQPVPITPCSGPTVCLTCGREAGVGLGALVELVTAANARSLAPAAPRVDVADLRAACERVGEGYAVLAATLRGGELLSATASATIALGDRLRHFGLLYGQYFADAWPPHVDVPTHAAFREDGPLAGPGFAPC